MPPVERPWGDMFEAIKQTAEGIQTIKDWLGEGGNTVSRERAESRADICRHCPANIRGTWWTRTTGGIADVIRQHLEAKNSEQLSVRDEHELGTCGICLCNLPLKIWVPTDTIQNHTDERLGEKFPDYCWQKKELTK